MAYDILSRAKSLPVISIIDQNEPSQIRRNSEAKPMCDSLEMPKKSPISFANAFMNSTTCSVNIQSLGANLDLKCDHFVASCNVLLLSETLLESGYPDTQFHSPFLKSKYLKEGKGRGDTSKAGAATN